MKGESNHIGLSGIVWTLRRPRQHHKSLLRPGNRSGQPDGFSMLWRGESVVGWPHRSFGRNGMCTLTGPYPRMTPDSGLWAVLPKSMRRGPWGTPVYEVNQ